MRQRRCKNSRQNSRKQKIPSTAVADLDSAKETLRKKHSPNTKDLVQKDVDKAQLIKNQAETIVSYLKIELMRTRQGDTSGVTVPRATTASGRTAPSDRRVSSTFGRPINQDEVDRWMNADR